MTDWLHEFDRAPHATPRLSCARRSIDTLVLSHRNIMAGAGTIHFPDFTRRPLERVMKESRTSLRAPVSLAHGLIISRELLAARWQIDCAGAARRCRTCDGVQLCGGGRCGSAVMSSSVTRRPKQAGRLHHIRQRAPAARQSQRAVRPRADAEPISCKERASSTAITTLR